MNTCQCCQEKKDLLIPVREKEKVFLVCKECEFEMLRDEDFEEDYSAYIWHDEDFEDEPIR